MDRGPRSSNRRSEPSQDQSGGPTENRSEPQLAWLQTGRVHESREGAGVSRSYLFPLEDVPQVFQPQTLQELVDGHVEQRCGDTVMSR